MWEPPPLYIHNIERNLDKKTKQNLINVMLRFAQKNQVFCSASVEPKFALWNLFWLVETTISGLKSRLGTGTSSELRWWKWLTTELQ
ncbi:hypothetical protein CHARACLAT_028277 [Characodon lateralis]|uniref:Uncharacterized protein n=1 Tax=Characodon lateralis TaxID=208331 RepID=A0ABU7D4R6_9TELE|nr:hypothetical protein [Characodon lateralis]